MVYYMLPYLITFRVNLYFMYDLPSTKVNRSEFTFVNCGHLKNILLLPDLKIW